MKNKVLKMAVAGFVLSVSGFASAGLITIGGGTIASPDRFEDFTYGSSIAGVSSEFAASGLEFTTLSGSGISLIRSSNCGNPGVSGDYLYMGVVPECNGNSSLDAVSIQFDTEVTELSWTGFSRASGFNVEALFDGSVVSSLLLDESNRFEDGTVLFSGSVFDEIRFTETSTSGVFFALDNLSWNITSVPEPSTLAIFALSLMGLASRRFKKS